MRRSIATPCPLPHPADEFVCTSFDDTTTTLNFTSAFRASFRDVKPRRRQKQPVHFAIHEDRSEDQRDGNGVYVPSSLSQPPRRPQAGPRKSQDTTAFLNGRVDHVPRRQPGSRLSVLPEGGSHVKSPQATEVARPPRRGTIYIPNEDTTMPSMYMGIFSPIKDLDLLSSSVTKSVEPQIEVTGIAAQMAVKRRNRVSMIADAPRRGILQNSTRALQEKTYAEDRYGQGDGKENVPPGSISKPRRVERSPVTVMKPQVATMDLESASRSERSSLYAPTSSSLLRSESVKVSVHPNPRPRPAWNGGARSRPVQSAPMPNKPSKPASPVAVRPVSPKPPVPTRFVIPSVPVETALQKHPIISEDLNSALYEEDWLSHQEAAITQLVNNLFSATYRDCSHDFHTLRRRLLEIYSSPTMTLMHKRLQAALLYGTLGIPQDVLSKGARLQTDIGLKKSFVDLWLHTYDLRALEVALEVVVGRQCRRDADVSRESFLSSSKCSRQRLRHFIEAFLIRNEDLKQESADRTASMYQRTMLRSLLLVKVLDLVKTEFGSEMTDPLFQRTSSFKTSASVVQALMQMLNPAVADPFRALGMIEYVVSHAQHALEEFDYQIENIAVDLRDGIRLTRIVELLLYPTSSVLKKQFDGATTTVIMPEGETVGFCDGQDRPLTQHLKMQCQSRAVRLWNVQLALSALQKVNGVSGLVDGIAAGDIVDGFREKTVGLLWALVGKWGLKGLIEWQDLEWETRRLGGTGEDSDDDDEELTFEDCQRRLRKWARAVASSRGLQIQNFTTAFGDGKAFEAIVDVYEPFIAKDDAGLAPRAALPVTLPERLIRLGCSQQFSRLFEPSSHVAVFDRDFVLGSLAFLCSRLLSPTRHARAGTVIQRAWRAHWTRVQQGRKRRNKEVAEECAEAAQQRQRQRQRPESGCAEFEEGEDVWLTL